MKYLVTGATGNIGSLVTERLIGAGATPCVLTRTPVITGPEALSYRQMATAIGEAIGKSVRYETLSDADAMAGALMWADRADAEALVATSGRLFARAGLPLSAMVQ